MRDEYRQEDERQEPTECQSTVEVSQTQGAIVVDRQRYEALLIELGELRKESQFLAECRQTIAAREKDLKQREREIEELKEILLETEWKDYELEQTQKRMKAMELELERFRKGPWWKRLLGV